MMSLYRMEAGTGWLARVESISVRPSPGRASFPRPTWNWGWPINGPTGFAMRRKRSQEIVKLDKTLLNEAREELELLKKIQRADPRDRLWVKSGPGQANQPRRERRPAGQRIPDRPDSKRAAPKKGVHLPILPRMCGITG
jgi:hypothetical protein